MIKKQIDERDVLMNTEPNGNDLFLCAVQGAREDQDLFFTYTDGKKFYGKNPVIDGTVYAMAPHGHFNRVQIEKILND